MSTKENGWLLEATSSHLKAEMGGHVYVMASDGFILPTPDHDAALRFARKQDAEAFITVAENFVSFSMVACEHAWG
jgi:hypothetical protein